MEIANIIKPELVDLCDDDDEPAEVFINVNILFLKYLICSSFKGKFIGQFLHDK